MKQVTKYVMRTNLDPVIVNELLKSETKDPTFPDGSILLNAIVCKDEVERKSLLAKYQRQVAKYCEKREKGCKTCATLMAHITTVQKSFKGSNGKSTTLQEIINTLNRVVN